jgi:serine/threonine protein kinase
VAGEFTGSRAQGPALEPAGSSFAPPSDATPEPIAATVERPSGPERRPSKTSPLGVGSDIGAYRLQQLLGTGGMGQVYLAEHRKLGRQVAIKLLLPDRSEDPEMVRRFFHEARVVNQIKHENIVEIFDFIEEVGGFNYLIMEFLEGQDLTQTRRRDGAFKIQRTLHILEQVCSALQAAHSKGVVHRDLKPDNIFLIHRTGQDDFVKLLDFGIAKMNAVTALKTNVGAVLGTPIYMSPEQAEGRAVDGRSDLYSLGVLLHWMLFDALPPRALRSGRRPLHSRTRRRPPAERNRSPAPCSMSWSTACASSPKTVRPAPNRSARDSARLRPLLTPS